jgi:hypothetical protein
MGMGHASYQPDGTALPAGSARTCRDERLDPDRAIYVCLANITREERQQQQSEIEALEPFRYDDMHSAAYRRRPKRVIGKFRRDRNRCGVHAR